MLRFVSSATIASSFLRVKSKTCGAVISSGDLSNIFNHPNFGSYEFSAVRSIDADAGSPARKRRPEWRPQSAVSNRRTKVGATGFKADFPSAATALPAMVPWLPAERSLISEIRTRISCAQTSGHVGR
jgi:hypothetical protein